MVKQRADLGTLVSRSIKPSIHYINTPQKNVGPPKSAIINISFTFEMTTSKYITLIIQTCDIDVVRVLEALGRQLWHEGVDLPGSVGQQALILVPFHVVVAVLDGHSLKNTKKLEHFI